MSRVKTTLYQSIHSFNDWNLPGQLNEHSRYALCKTPFLCTTTECATTAQFLPLAIRFPQRAGRRILRGLGDKSIYCMLPCILLK